MHRKCSVAAGYKARISSLDEEETKGEGRSPYLLRFGIPDTCLRACFGDLSLMPSQLNEKLFAEYKIRKLAEILGTDVEQASSLVKLRPGLLVVPNGDMSFYEHRVSRLAFKHGLSPRQVSVMVLENPQLLFSPRV